MFTVDYLLQVLPELEQFEDPEKIPSQVLSGEGYDGIIAILENLRTAQFPCIIVEDRSIGNILIDSGTLDSFTIAMWVMIQKTDLSVTEQYKSAFSLGLEILKLLIRDKNLKSELSGFDYSGIQYNKRMGPDCYGYEFVLTFREDIDLSDD